MSEKQRLSTNEYTKILMPASSYDMAKDSRILIPFTSGEKIGFVNREGVVVVKPEYTMYYGEFYNEQDLVKVAIDYTYGFIRSGGKVATYLKLLYGLINVKGEMVLNAEYSEIVPSIGGGLLFTVQKNGQYGVLDASGMEIVPFGRYGYIDGFDKGLARVKVGTTTNGVMDNGCRWGIIDNTGKEVLPAQYDAIWNFYGKSRDTTRVEKEDSRSYIKLSSLLDNEEGTVHDSYYDNDYDDYGTHYGEYAGTYAQDVAGYSDDAIDDAFDGDPDAYWNID